MPIESFLRYEKPSRQYKISPDFDAILPFWLVTDQPNQQVTVPAGTVPIPGLSASYPMTYRYQGPFRGHYLQYWLEDEAEDHLLANMVDGRDGYQYMNRGLFVHLNTIGSLSINFPAVLPEALILQQLAALNVQFANLEDEVDVRLVIEGCAYDPSRLESDKRVLNRMRADLNRLEYLRPHFAPLDDQHVTVDHGDTQQFFMTVDDAGFFEIFKITAVTYEEDTVTAFNLQDLLFRFFDYTGRQLTTSNGPDIPGSLLCGTGAQPNILPARWMVPPKGQVRVEITNNNAQTDADIWLTFSGRRIYTRG